MRYTKAFAAALFGVAVSGTAALAGQDVRPYVGLDYNFVDPSKKTGVVTEDQYHGATPVVGVRVGQYFGAEAGYLYTNSESVTVAGVKTTSRFKGYHLDLNAYYPVAEKIELIGTVGLGRYTFTEKALGTTGKVRDTAWRLGGGAQYNLTENVSIRGLARYVDVNYKNVAGTKTVDGAWTWNLGVSYAF